MIETKIASLKRDYYIMSKLPKPKPVSMDNVKIEDLIKNNSTLEDLIVK